MANNADLGITLQKTICDIYNLKLSEHTANQFEANYNLEYVDKLEPLVGKIFSELGSTPVECLTYTKSKKGNETLSPHNFVLANNMTLSIRTTKNGDKVAPRVVGQCGINVFNAHFSEIAGYQITDKQEIKEIVYNKIDKMIPIFLDYLLISDYTVWIFETNNGYDYRIIDREQTVDIETVRNAFTFTRNLEDWNESTTLKYNGSSLAEIQIHKNRTFKFRFIMKALLAMLVLHKNTTETFGITAEKTICDLFEIDVPENYKGRTSISIQSKLMPTVFEAFKHIPKPIKSTGAEKGSRGKQSKSPYDFILEGNKTLSLKTNTGNMICPSEVGQPGAETCYYYFKHLTEATEITETSFKEMVLSNVDKMVPIYLDHLFDCDYLLWLYERKSNYYYKIFDINFAKKFIWKKDGFTFTKNTLEEWNESNTLKYNGISIGEFQVHKARSCFKFRFNIENLEKVIMEAH